MQDVKDITIIGAGPTGLFGAFYAGMRGASCRLIDNLDQVGGQLTALYPEKYIFDVAGFPKVLSKDLVKGMAEQAFQFKQPVHLGENVTGLKRDSENGKPAFKVVERLAVDNVIPQLGFISSLGAIAQWGLDIEKGEIKVSQTMATNLPGVFAAGDITTYPGKLKLIATGAAEAAIAVNHAVHFINPAAKVAPGHSSNMALFGQTED